MFFLFLLGYLWPLIIDSVTKNKPLVSIIATIGSGFALITGIGVAIPPIGALWNWLTGKVQSNVDQNASNGISGALPSLAAMLWDTAQQEEINNATYVRAP